MNPISAITPISVQNANIKSSKPQNNINFTGNLGDKFVRQIIQGENVDSKKILSEVKGTFSLSSSKVEDVMESFISKLRELSGENSNLSDALSKAQEKISITRIEKDHAVSTVESRLKFQYQKELAEKDALIERMRTTISKFEPAFKVKSVDEINTIMPDKALSIMEEMKESKTKAVSSMFEFLMTGKGQQEAIKQIERNSMLLKASDDGMFKIHELNEGRDNLHKAGIYPTLNPTFAIALIEQALMGSEKGQYIVSPVIAKQVKDNAMAILTPLEDRRYWSTNLEGINKSLNDTIENVINFHNNFLAGIKNLKSRSVDSELEIVRKDFDINNSYVIFNEKGASEPRKLSFRQVESIGAVSSR